MNFFLKNLFLLICVFSFRVSAQQNRIDSLRKALYAEKEDTVLLFRLVELSEQCDLKDIFTYAGPAVELADKLLSGDPKNKKSILKAKADAINNIGYAYNEKADLSNALENYHKSLALKEEIGDKKGIATLLNNIGYVYLNQSDHEKALNYFTKSLKVREGSKDKAGIAESFNNIGVIYKLQRNYPKALEYYTKSLKLFEEIGDEITIPQLLNNLGVIYQDMGDNKRSLEYYLRTQAIQEKANDKNGLSYTLLNIGVLYHELKDFKKAEEYCMKAMKLSKELGSPENIRNTANRLSKIYADQNKFKEAYDMYRVFKHMADSVSNVETRNSLVKKDMQYEFDKTTAAEKIKSEKKEALAAEEKERQKIFTYSISVVLILVFLLTLFIYRGSRQKQMANLALEEKSKIIEEKNKDITDSIRYAKFIQEAVLPSEEAFNEFLPKSFILFKPKDIVSGDFFWIGTPRTNYGEDLVVYAAADCTGHGVPGAFLSMVGSNYLHLGLTEKGVNSSGEALDFLNKGIISLLKEKKKEDKMIRDGMDISMCAINFQTMKLEFAAANNPLYFIRNNELREIKGDKRAIGEMRIDNTGKYTNHHIDLKKDDSIYIFSDGFADQFGGPKQKKFKYKQLQEKLLAICDLPADEQKTILERTFEEWKGDLEQVDDVLIIGVKI